MIVSHVNGFWSNERKHFIIKVYDLFAMVFTLLLHGIAVCVCGHVLLQGVYSTIAHILRHLRYVP